MLPAAVPAAAGANVTVNIAFWPGARICPLAPVVAKPGPEIIVSWIVTLDPPEFVTDTARVLLLPVSTFPKLSAAVEAVN